MREHLSIAIVAVLYLTGCSDQTADNQRDKSSMPTRPVTVLELSERDYARERRLTGSVNLYREEKIGFEVSGRVISVLDKGIEVRGPAYDENNKLVRRGDRISTMENTRYRLQVDALQARLKAAKRDLDAMKAQVRLARQTVDRQRRVLSEGAGAQQAVDNAASEFDQAIAQEMSRRATIDEIREQVGRLREDLDDTILYAPFSGRITAVHISGGAVVKSGQPVVTLTLMDPVHVQVEVSADDERQIKTGDRAIIYPKDPARDGKRVPVYAIVFEKSAVADPKFRTFRIDLIVRNARRHLEPQDPNSHGLPVVNDYLPVVKEYQGETGPLFIPTNSVYVDQEKHHVLRLPGVSFHPGARRSAVGKHLPESIPVTLGDDYTTVIKWNFRSIVDEGTLREGDFLILDPMSEYLNGVISGRPQWLLRPRDLVPVQFSLSSVPHGFYVPIDAITLIGRQHIIFTIDGGKAKATNISVHETYRELRRIEGNGITTGEFIIVGGVHYITDGQPVSITKTKQIP